MMAVNVTLAAIVLDRSVGVIAASGVRLVLGELGDLREGGGGEGIS